MSSNTQLLSDAIALATLNALNKEADRWYANIDNLLTRFGPMDIIDHLPAGTVYLPTASSIGLTAVMPAKTLIEAFSPALKNILRTELGPTPMCDINITWLRRQYPPCSRPLLATPHGWHQDGAFGIDFMDTSEGSDYALLPMITVWLPLHSCGKIAPGIELIPHTPASLLLPEQLTNEAVSARWPPSTIWRPVMQATDALLIDSHTLHRTYCNSSMTQLRGCVELRFFSEQSIPARVAKHQFIPCV